MVKFLSFQNNTTVFIWKFNENLLLESVFNIEYLVIFVKLQ